jgi:hypothetical protein
VLKLVGLGSVACAVGLLMLAPNAFAGQRVTATLNPPPPSFLTCKATGTGTICSGTRVRVKDPVDTGIVCGSGAEAFNIYDQGVENQRLTFRYDVDGNLESIVNHERWTESWWSNSLTGAVLPYTQNNVITTVLARPGDFGSATETTVGELIFTDTATGSKVLRNVGRGTVGPGGTVEFTSAKQPFLDGDPPVVDVVCAALA